MILPQKHIKLSESIFAMGAIILSLLHNHKSIGIDELWEKLMGKNRKDKIIDNYSFDKFIISLDYLFTIGVIDINENGGLIKCI
ncbi:ABC-three component system middle component 6 [Virgibacillus sp. 6R]|uniref:ABC-three component system middle component 6 n=1 Tax=Metabacillus sp. 22489 TaxID=3453928 RepID=UPI00119FE168